jgi:hypothetical protein
MWGSRDNYICITQTICKFHEGPYPMGRLIFTYISRATTDDHIIFASLSYFRLMELIIALWFAFGFVMHITLKSFPS